jgi:hypothetical protein
MNRIVITFIFSLLFVSAAYCDSFTVKLKPKKEVVVEGRTYYIDKVIDARASKSKIIGTIGSEKRSKDLVLENDLEPYFYGYLSFVFPKNKNTSQAITLSVNSIVCESNPDGATMKAQVSIEVQFIFQDGSILTSKNYNSINTIFPDGKAFGKLLEKCLIDAVSGLKDNLK